MSKKKFNTFLRFCTVGVGNTLIDFGIFFILTACFVPYLVAQCFSYSAGMLNSYIWNRRWTFDVQKKADKWELMKFITVNLIASLFTFFVLYVSQKSGVSLFVSKVMATIIGLAVNFIGSRLWVFKMMKNV
ncbi:GtrA family protein [Bacillus sp. NPDC077027]|uniref:GtrA family protein n=1 Tax=Bacillus sp. NPDC077027 TaxID=3390548 RepID=UPI003D018D2A